MLEERPVSSILPWPAIDAIWGLADPADVRSRLLEYVVVNVWADDRSLQPASRQFGPKDSRSRNWIEDRQAASFPCPQGKFAGIFYGSGPEAPMCMQFSLILPEP
jgi:hypothetical protein